MKYCWHTDHLVTVDKSFLDSHEINNSRVFLNFRSKSSIGKLPWPMTFNSLAIESHWPQSYLEARGQMVFFEAFEAK